MLHDILKSLATCKHMKVLNLGYNKIGAEAGHDLAQSIRSWGDDPPLEDIRSLQLFNTRGRMV